MSERTASEALQALLHDLPTRVPVERIEGIWLFAPRDIAGKESGLLVLSLFPGPERPPGQRQVVTWSYEAERVRGRLQRADVLAEEGWAPAERLPQLIEGVLTRLGDGSEEPRLEVIGGSKARWTALLVSIRNPPVDSPGGE